MNSSSKSMVLPVLKAKSQSLHQDFPGQSQDFRNKAFFHNIDKNSLNSSINTNKTVNFKTPMGSKFKNNRNSTFYEKRVRNFMVKLTNRVHIFYGLSYVQYDAFLRKDFFIQQVIIRDILNMLLDKASTLKNMLNNITRMKKILENLRRFRQAELNIKLETIIGLIDFISRIILLDFKTSYSEVGINESPIEKPQKFLIPIKNEIKAFEVNAHVYTEIVEFFRDCLDCFFIVLRQARKRLFDEETAINLIKAISETRFSIGKLYEEYLMHEKIAQAKEKGHLEEIMVMIKKKKKEERDRSLEKTKNIERNQEITEKDEEKDKENLVLDNNPITANINNSLYNDNIGQNKSKKQKKIVEKEMNYENEEKLKGKLLRMEKLKVLTTLLQNKFKFQGSKFVTRESKIPLNSMKIDREKQVLLDADSIKSQRIIADNRKKVMLDRITNPFCFTGGMENMRLLRQLGDFAHNTFSDN